MAWKETEPRTLPAGRANEPRGHDLALLCKRVLKTYVTAKKARSGTTGTGRNHETPAAPRKMPRWYLTRSLSENESAVSGWGTLERDGALWMNQRGRVWIKRCVT